MIYKEIEETIANLENEWEHIIKISSQLEEYLSKYEQMRKNLLQNIVSLSNSVNIANSSNQLANRNSEIKNYLSSFDFQMISFFEITRHFKEKCEEVSDIFIFKQNLENINISSKIFLKDLQKYYNTKKNSGTAMKLIDSMKIFVENVKILQDYFNFIKNIGLILQEPNTYLDEEILEFRSFDKVSFENFVSSLNAIKEMYEMAKTTLKIDGDLEIIKIESGSLFTKLKGNPIIIGIIISSLHVIADDFYSHELGFNSKNIQLEEFKTELEIKKSLEEMGIDTTGIDDSLNTLSAKLFKGSKQLIDSSSKVSINGKDYGKNDSSQKQIENKIKLLENK